MQVTIIGDVHGKVAKYKEITDKCDFSICVGDFGFKIHWDWHSEYILAGIHDINMGNHDYVPYVTTHPASCRNWNYYPAHHIFTVRGADSIDKHLRTEGIDWFSNEELNYQEQLEAYDAYCKHKPRIVISHDCPQNVMYSLFGYSDKSQTRQMLQAMFEEHRPNLWVFGHHHKSRDVDILGTRFVCLSELETFKI